MVAGLTAKRVKLVNERFIALIVNRDPSDRGV